MLGGHALIGPYQSLIAGGSWSYGQRSFAPVPLVSVWLGTSLGFLLGTFLSSKSTTWGPWLAGTTILTYHLWMAWEWVRILQDSMQTTGLVMAHLVVRILAFYASTFALRSPFRDEMLLVSLVSLFVTSS